MSQNNSSLTQAINDMRTMREAYDQLGAAAEAYNAGKTELAQNINAKGVEASASESLPELAEKVAAIAQETYEINGGEMYAKQLFGSLETPNYWNLYDILAQLLSDGRLINYGGILLAEYYRGYDSIALSGAGAGGAYVVSDLDENGQFKIYTEDTTHTWATEFDGKGNRWVAYCFADEYHDFQITNTNTSPRSIFIGRKVGEIKLMVNARISQIVVPDGNKLRSFNPQTYTCPWNKQVSFKNLGTISKALLYNPTSIEGLYVGCDGITAGHALFNGSFAYNCSIVVESSGVISGKVIMGGFDYSNIPFLAIKAPILNGTYDNPTIIFQGGSSGFTIKEIAIITEEGVFYTWNGLNSPYGRTQKIYIGYIENNKTKSVSLASTAGNYTSVTDLEIQNGWCKPLNIPKCTSLTKENVQAHIFDRLGVNDLSTGVVTITLATAVLNLFTQEEINAVVARTNITIVGA